MAKTEITIIIFFDVEIMIIRYDYDDNRQNMIALFMLDGMFGCQAKISI